MRTYLYVLLALLATSPCASAQILISNFSNLAGQAYTPFNLSWNGGSPDADQFVQNSGNVSITAVDGGNPDGRGSFDAVFPGADPNNASSINFTGIKDLQLTAQINTGNTNTSFIVVISDNNDVEIGQATFYASSFNSSFSTVNAAFQLTGGGNVVDATYWTLGGDAVLGDSVRASFDNLTASDNPLTTAAPEPSASVLICLGLLAFGLHRRWRATGLLSQRC